MILRVCEACEKVAPAGDPSREPDRQRAIRYRTIDAHTALGLADGWVHLELTRSEDHQVEPVDLCSPRCLRVWAQATADDLVAAHPELEAIEEAAAATRARGEELGGGDLVPCQWRPGDPTVLVHRRRLEAVDALPTEAGERPPNPAFVACPWCAAAPMQPCRSPEVVSA